MESIEWDGTQITKPGMYSRVPMDTYHIQDICDGPSVSSSDLRLCFSKSAAHAYDKWSGNPKREEEEEEDGRGESEKKHFIVGRAMHHLMLGEPFFAKLFAEQPTEYSDASGELKKWNGNANVCKTWKKKQDEVGRSILTAKDVRNIRGMAISLTRHPFVAQSGLLNGQVERSMFWRDQQTGIWLKSRPDNIPPSNDFVDLKTTKSVLWPDLQREIKERGYYQQGALICRGAREVLKIANPTFTLIFVEKTSPWCVETVQLKDNDLDRGERANRASIDTFAEGLKTGAWLGPGGNRDDARPIEMSEWAQKQIDDKLKFGI